MPFTHSPNECHGWWDLNPAVLQGSHPDTILLLNVPGKALRLRLGMCVKARMGLELELETLGWIYSRPRNPGFTFSLLLGTHWVAAESVTPDPTCLPCWAVGRLKRNGPQLGHPWRKAGGLRRTESNLKKKTAHPSGYSLAPSCFLAQAGTRRPQEVSRCSACRVSAPLLPALLVGKVPWLTSH